MSHIPPLPTAKALPEVRAVYKDFHTRMSFPSAPNFILTQGHSPTVVRGTWNLVENVLVMGQIPRWAKELIFVAISHDRQCRYCTAAHVACCRMIGVDPKVIEQAMSNVDAIADPRARGMVAFALKCSRVPQTLADNDYEALYRLGITRSEAVELVAMSALAVYANIIADATAMEQDEMFDNPVLAKDKKRTETPKKRSALRAPVAGA